MNKANKITMTRIIMSLIIITIMLFPFDQVGLEFPTYILNGNITINLKYIIVGFLFIIASLTDFLDGYVARKYNIVTDFGKMIDAISDKLLTNSVLIILACAGKISTIVTVVIVMRDIIVDSINEFKSIEYDNWYKNTVDNSTGIWIGNGINDQFSLKINQKIPELRENDVPESFCFVIHKGKPKYVKYIEKV